MLYGRDEIVAFAKGMAAHTGVDIRIHNGQPRTDGQTVWLDCSPCNTEVEYQIRTGDADHEIAHVWFGSVQALKGAAAAIAKACGRPELEWAAHECLNVALDIHDETRMEHLLPNVQDALRQGNLQAGKTLWDGGAYRNGPKWRTKLLLGILAARLGRTRKAGSWLVSGRRYTFCHAYLNRMIQELMGRWSSNRPQQQQGKAILAVCQRCKERSASDALRSRSEWQKIREHGRKLFELVLPDIQDSDKMPEKPQQGQQGGQGGAAGGQPQPGEQQNDPGKRLREAALGNERGGSNPHPFEQVITDPGPGQSDDPSGGSGDQFGGSGAGIQRGNGSAHVGTANGFYGQCLRTMGKAIEVMMETQDSMRLNHYRDTGDRLGRKWANLFTSGAVFVTKDHGDGRELNLAMLLDRSGSMCHILDKCAAACAAIGAVAQANGANVECWLFGDGAAKTTLQAMSQGVESEGSTYGADALRLASRWLRDQQSGRKLCIVVTDGDFSDPTEARRCLLEHARQGVEYVFIGLGMSKDRLLGAWPAGLRGIGCAADANQLADQLLLVAGPEAC